MKQKAITAEKAVALVEKRLNKNGIEYVKEQTFVGSNEMIQTVISITNPNDQAKNYLNLIFTEGSCIFYITGKNGYSEIFRNWLKNTEFTDIPEADSYLEKYSRDKSNSYKYATRKNTLENIEAVLDTFFYSSQYYACKAVLDSVE